MRLIVEKIDNDLAQICRQDAEMGAASGEYLTIRGPAEVDRLIAQLAALRKEFDGRGEVHSNR